MQRSGAFLQSKYETGTNSSLCRKYYENRRNFLINVAIMSDMYIFNVSICVIVSFWSLSGVYLLKYLSKKKNIEQSTNSTYYKNCNWSSLKYSFWKDSKYVWINFFISNLKMYVSECY